MEYSNEIDLEEVIGSMTWAAGKVIEHVWNWCDDHDKRELEQALDILAKHKPLSLWAQRANVMERAHALNLMWQLALDASDVTERRLWAAFAARETGYATSLMRRVTCEGEPS